MPARALILAALAGALLGPATATGSGYAELRAAAVKRCEAIDPAEYQTGLMLNPDGYRSYYVRSACFQRAAGEFRDESLCREVKRRWPGLPVIAISGGGWIGANELLGMAERLGADNILQKPVRRDDLIRAVDDALAANLKKQA